MPSLYHHIRLILLSILLLSWGTLPKTYAQAQYAFRISFTDKQYQTSDTLIAKAQLSDRALARRSKQGILLDSNDIAIPALYIDSVLHSSSAILHLKSKWLNHIVILLSDTSSISSIRTFDFVKDVEWIAQYPSPLHELKTTANRDLNFDATHSGTPLFRQTSDLGYYADAYEQISMANGQALHNKGYRAKNMLIAVIDEGFYKADTMAGYDSLRLRNGIIDTYNFNLDTSNVYGYSEHGTLVLSTMAGILNKRFVGTAPDADYALYVSEASGSEQPIEMDNLLAALERADSIGADLASISLGYNSFNVAGIDKSMPYTLLDGHSTIAARAANIAVQKGMMVVASAGNDGATAWKYILSPGDADSALTCGSVDPNRNIASTSGRGPNASGRIKPDVCMMGAPGVVLNTTGGTSSVGGTSIATPELAGLVACLWQARPNWTPFQLKEAIRKSAHLASSPNNDYGYGIPDFGSIIAITDTPVCNCAAPDILLFPNPNKGQFTILYTTDNMQYYEWCIQDMVGKRILSGKGEQAKGNTVNISIILPENWSKGIYFMQFRGDVMNKTIRFLKE